MEDPFGRGPDFRGVDEFSRPHPFAKSDELCLDAGEQFFAAPVIAGLALDGGDRDETPAIVEHFEGLCSFEAGNGDPRILAGCCRLGEHGGDIFVVVQPRR